MEEKPIAIVEIGRHRIPADLYRLEMHTVHRRSSLAP